MERGILVLVDHADDAQLGPLVRALCADHPEIQVLTEAARVEEAPHGAAVVLATRAEDAVWLNLARPIFAERALRVILWSKAETTAEIARRAPDFFDWIARRFECPSAPPAFAVAGLRAALRARAWAVAWRGRALEEAFAAAFPRRKLIQANAALPDGALLEIAKGAGSAWIAWSNVLDERGVRRVRRIAAEAGRRGRNILDNPGGEAPKAWPVSDSTTDLGEAARALEGAGASSAGRLAALLDLEPEAIALAVEQVRGGIAASAIEEAIRRAPDPGAALGKLAEDRVSIDPVLIAAYQVRAPILRAFATDPRVREAGATLAGDAGPALAPLTEKIAPGPSGAAEFARLMEQLLSIDTSHLRLFDPAGRNEASVDILAPGGFPGMVGSVAFQFRWPDCTPSDIRGAISRVPKKLHIKHLVLISPLDPTPVDRASARRHAPRRGPHVHLWGQTRIEELLRRCPALLARYYPEEARAYLPGYDGTDFGTLATRYREKIKSLHDRLKTIGIPPEARPRESRVELPLAELFIPLRLVSEEHGVASIELADAINHGQSAVILANPGMGKSTLLAYLALAFAGGASLPGLTRTPHLIPLHISLRDFVRLQKQRPGLSFLDYLDVEARKLLPELHRAFFEATLRMGEAMVLFDGLDEVGNETARHAISTSIHAFQADYPDCLFWVTSRIYGYTENVRLPSSFVHYYIERFDDAQIDDFIDRWYAHQITANPEEAKEQAASLREAVQRTRSVRRLAGNPLLLTLMAFIHHDLRRLPKDRGELYEKCTEMLLKTWQEAKRGDGEAARGMEGLTLNVPTQKDYLAHLAFFIQQKNQGGADEDARGLVSRREAIEALTSRHLARARRERETMTELEARDEMARFLDHVCDETGLVLDRGNGQLSFIHLSFQEYLAAWVFVCDDEMPHGAGFFLEHLGDPTWEEVLLLRLYIVLRDGGGVKRFDEILAAVLRSLARKSAPEAWLTLVHAIRDDLEFKDRDRKEIIGKALDLWLEAPAFGGTWYSALEEVKLFTERAEEMLRGVIAEVRARARKPGAVIALLHLETALFAFPEGSVGVLRQRADLGELLADLVPFADEPAVRALLAEKARVVDWIRALRALDGPEVYRLTLRWSNKAPAPTAAAAATALLWDKILTDLRSRANFAAPRRGHKDTTLFDQPGALIYKTPFTAVTLPYACLRALPASLPTAASVRPAPLLCPSLAKAWSIDGDADASSDLTTWMTGFMASKLDRFPAAGPLDRYAMPYLAALFAKDLGDDIVRDHVDDFRNDTLSGASVDSFGDDFGQSFVHEFNSDIFDELGSEFSTEFGGEFGQSFNHGFGYEFVRGFGGHHDGTVEYDFVAELVYEFGIDPEIPGWQKEWERALEDDDTRLQLLDHEAFWRWMLSDTGFGEIDSHRSVTALGTELNNPLAFPLLLTDIWRAAAVHHLLAWLRHAAVAYPGEGTSTHALQAWLLNNPTAVYATSFAWQEHCEDLDDVAGETTSLTIAHAAYASLMTGLECRLPFSPDLTDPRVRLSYLLYELCHFRDAEGNIRKLEQEIASPAPELRPLLEAAGMIAATEGDHQATSQPDRPKASSQREPEPEPPVLFSWLHLSDVHCGQRSMSQHGNQTLILDALYRDIAAHKTRDIPTPDAILITGDIAFSGAPDQYAHARAWLDELAAIQNIPANRIFLVPGNHDIDRAVEGKSRNVARLLRGLREGDDLLDDVLADPDDRALLTSRLTAYLTFASAYPSIQAPDPLSWSHAFASPRGLPVRLVGLSTPLLAGSDVDHGKLRLGNAALAATFTDTDKSRELVIALTHHPLRGGWLADQSNADHLLQRRAHLHLFGHVHEADAEHARSGAGPGLIRVASGAVHGDMPLPDTFEGYGYNVGAVVATGGYPRLRLWPRRWSGQTKDFRVDVDNVPEGRSYTEHPLSGLRLPTTSFGVP